MQEDYEGGEIIPVLPCVCGWKLGREPMEQTLWLLPLQATRSRDRPCTSRGSGQLHIQTQVPSSPDPSGFNQGMAGSFQGKGD